MMKFTRKFVQILLAGACLLLASAAGAQSAAPPPDARTNAAAIKTEESAVLRDPFSPIGYVPAALASQAKASEPAAGPAKPAQPGGVSAMLKIGGVVQKGGRYYATINGFTVQAGEIVTTLWNGGVYKFLVEKIDLKTVKVKMLKQ